MIMSFIGLTITTSGSKWQLKFEIPQTAKNEIKLRATLG